MSYKISQLSPQSSTHGTNLRLLIKNGSMVAHRDSRNIQWLRSWFEYDSQLAARRQSNGLNWNVILGLGLMIGVSSAVWTVVGLTLSRLVK